MLQTTVDITPPSPLAVRTLAWALGTTASVLIATLRRIPRFRRVSISPISSQWLDEHEILSSKQQDNF